MNDSIIKKVERLLKNNYKTIKIDKPYIDEILKLAKIIAHSPMVMPMDPIEGSRSPQIAIEETAEFFGQVSIDWQNRFYNMINNENSIKFVKDIELLEQSFVNNDGFTQISYKGALSDSYTLIHEILHKFSLIFGNNETTFSNSILECPTIYSELLFKDYIKLNNKYSNDEINECIYDRFCNVYCQARYIIFEIALFSYFQKYKSIANYDYFKSYCISLGLESYEVNNSMAYLAKQNELQYSKTSMYIIGMLFSCYYHQKYKNDIKLQYHVLKEITDICSLNDLKSNEIIERLKALKVPFITNDFIEVSDKARSVLSIAYVKELHSLIKEQKLEKSKHVR